YSTIANYRMLSTIATIFLLILQVAAFKVANVRMQTRDIRYCNPNMLGPDGKPVKCYISKSVETAGLVYPGMDDGKSYATRHDIFITKDGQVTVGASPDRPYEYFLHTDSANGSSMLQLYNQTSYPVVNNAPTAQEFLHDLSDELSLEDLGWLDHGIVDVDGEKLHKRVIYGVNGTDPKTEMNFTALAMTGLIPNIWFLYTDEADEKMVKLLSANTFQNNTVYEE
ncbi:hypothetical protein FOL47_002689, partial [Perkinsus chesapeaki]